MVWPRDEMGERRHANRHRVAAVSRAGSGRVTKLHGGKVTYFEQARQHPHRAGLGALVDKGEISVFFQRTRNETVQLLT